MSDSFVHLHVHSEYSMLDGAARVKPLIESAAAQGMPGVAITDHGNMFGAFDFWRTATDAGIKPIIGTEAYLTPGTHRTDKTRIRWGDGGGDDVSGSGAYTHMTMLAATTEGMHNLFRLSSYASMEGYYFKPRMDRELLSRYSKGIIATTGCPSGEVQTRLRLGQYEAARAAAADFRDIFGKENFFAEIMDHGLGIERRIMSDLIRLAKDLGLPLVATNDLHYTHAEDAKSHAALLCVQSGSTLDDPNRFKFDADEFYLKTPEQMRQLFRDYPDACDNTLAIAERCDVRFDTAANYMPRFPVPEGETEQTWFVKEVEKGLEQRYPDGITPEVRKQADYEIGVISQMGFPGYFLVVADFINWSKRNGIRVGPGRGSGAGSMAAYAMRITDLDPLQHGLIFERFLNPDRVSMPDFDVDFDDRRRGEVIKYVTEKYGSERVAQIVTYGTIKAKQALKDSGRVLGFPFSMGEKLTKAMPPPVMGKDIPLTGIFDKDHPRYKEAVDIRAVVESDPEAKTVFDTALGLENLKRQWGVHAAGVIMSSDPLIDVIPIMKREQDGQIVTQFDYPACESLGLIKMDFLGLRNLTIINDALDNIRDNRGEELVLEDLALDDRGAYDLLSRGDTLGVFQLDGGPMRSLLRLMKPDNFEDISALIALYRPGPMGANSHTNYALRKNGQQAITPIHPELAEPLEDILSTSYGLIIYQEQVMAIAQKVAGFSLGQADILRRAMGKKKKSELDKQFEG
ncbi:MAG: DNA polymerase III subunit alpha, partial [Leifsonia sp.]